MNENYIFKKNMKTKFLDYKSIQKMYDIFSSIPGFWELDAAMGKATENSPYRAQAIELLKLNPTSRILDVACGTGLNFKLVQKYLKNQGKLIGIDISKKTLDLARKRILKSNWNNIDIIEINAENYQNENSFDAALCTFAIDIIPSYTETIDMMIRSVKSGGRIAIIGFKPSSWNYFRLFNSIFKKFSIVFGADLDRDIRYYLSRQCQEIFYKEVYGGYYYILVVQK